jgi:hypothetical protein
MKATLSIENIEIYGKVRKRWVAEITGITKNNKYDREFIVCKRDYTKANQRGNRGIYSWYILESEKMYEVYRPLNWSKHERFLCKVSEDGAIIKITEENVKKWLKENILE